MEAKIRECDLLQALDRMHEATLCWTQAITLFPQEHVPHNELGNIYGRAGELSCLVTIYHPYPYIPIATNISGSTHYRKVTFI